MEGCLCWLEMSTDSEGIFMTAMKIVEGHLCCLEMLTDNENCPIYHKKPWIEYWFVIIDT